MHEKVSFWRSLGVALLCWTGIGVILGWGLYVDSLPKALLTALVCLAGFLLFNYVLVATARGHASVARSLLSEPSDPLKEAKEIVQSFDPAGVAADAAEEIERVVARLDRRWCSPHSLSGCIARSYRSVATYSCACPSC